MTIGLVRVGVNHGFDMILFKHDFNIDKLNILIKKTEKELIEMDRIKYFTAWEELEQEHKNLLRIKTALFSKGVNNESI
jgi:hypothetical protein